MKNPKVDFFFLKESTWQKSYQALRAIAVGSGLTEELKWGKPCYTLQGKNVFLIHGFKAYCALLFHKGALLKDAKNILIQQTENVQAGRQLRFTSVSEVFSQEDLIKAYIHEAIQIEKEGKEVTLKKTSEFEVPEELEQKFQEDPSFKKAFFDLTPGRQRGYLLYFGDAKQSKTRTARIEKFTPHIFNGKGHQER